MTNYANDFEGGTDTVAITTGNSGGVSGDAFSLMSTPVNSSMVFSTAAAAHGVMGCKIETTAATIAVYGQKDVTPEDRYVGRFYHDAPVIPTTSGTAIFGFRTAAATAAFVGYNSTGKLTIYNTSGSAVASTTFTPTAGVKYRIEFACNAVTGKAELAVYLGDSTTPIETPLDPAAGQSFGAAQITRYRLGRLQGTAFIGVFNYDSLRVLPLVTGLVGPVSSGATTVRPSGITNTDAWTNEGGAASLQAALADESNTTYVQSPANPTNDVFIMDYPVLADTLDIVVAVIHSTSASSPVITHVYDLLQGSTVISTRTVVGVPTTPTAYSWTTSAGETAGVTDRSQLKLRVTANAA